MKLEDELRIADVRGVAPPQNWTTRAADELAALRDDAERWRCLLRYASLGFDGALSWNAVIRLPVFDSEDQTITAIVDRALALNWSDG